MLIPIVSGSICSLAIASTGAGAVSQEIFDEDEARTPATEIEAIHDLKFMPFDVNGDKIDWTGSVNLLQDLIERSDRHLNGAVRFDGRQVELSIERGVPTPRGKGFADCRRGR